MRVARTFFAPVAASWNSAINSTATTFDLQPLLTGKLVELDHCAKTTKAACSISLLTCSFGNSIQFGTEYEQDVFARFFQESLHSGGALVISDRGDGANRLHAHVQKTFSAASELFV